MIIRYSDPVITSSELRMIEMGYVEKYVHSIHFDRYYTEEEKRNNSSLYSSMTYEEWNNHCDQVAESFADQMAEILDTFTGKYNIHQTTPETSTLKHFRSNWDLFFKSHTIGGFNSKNRFDSFMLAFNSNRTNKQNMALLEEILKTVEAMEYKNIVCYVVYNLRIDKEKIEPAAAEAFKEIAGKFVFYSGYKGKIRIVGEQNGKPLYGFFRKGARTKYFPLKSYEVLAMTLT